MARIFLSYRSGDDAYAAALLDQRLSDVFGESEVFRASRSIGAGVSYSDEIMHALKQCEVVLVLVGPTWTDRLDLSGRQRADVDWVRTEVSTALDYGLRVIPVLLSRTDRLVDCQLPPDIAALARLQSVRFQHNHIDQDFANLVASLGLGHEAARQPSPREHSVHSRRFSIRREFAADGAVELDLAVRTGNGVLAGRLSGRAFAGDLPRLAALIDGAARPAGEL
jgi:hypothetical protein